ncbi:MAG: hypothetical protein K6F09_07080 [Clostridiales bacterium]|nr:hypothetical protein [Clostridiales bacterium]
MFDFRILTDDALLHLAREKLIVLAVVFLLILAVTAVLVGIQLHNTKPRKSDNSEDDTCL